MPSPGADPRHRRNNFDALRLIAALSVVFSHSFLIAEGSEANEWFVRLNGNQAVLGAATYHDQYVRDNGAWKFRHVRIESHFWTPFEEGWARTQFIQRRAG